MKATVERFKEVYGNEHYLCSYEDLMENLFGLKFVVEESDCDYQGDSMCLVQEKAFQRLGYFDFGWGSCSGCDALQSCGGPEEYVSLANDLYNSIRWFDTQEEAVEYLTKEKDYAGSYNSALGLKFKESVKKYFALDSE